MSRVAVMLDRGLGRRVGTVVLVLTAAALWGCSGSGSDRDMESESQASSASGVNEPGAREPRGTESGSSEPSAAGPGTGEGEALAPLGMDLPHVVEPACPGEGCAYGTWMACDSVPVMERATADAGPIGYLTADQPFEVRSGRVIVEVPKTVVVTRPTRQFGFSGEGVLFAEGDTLYVLDYLGEGFFNAWHAGSIIETEVFWPWDAFIPGTGFEYGGRVIQAGRMAFWVRVAAGEMEGWVRADQPNVLAANSIDPAPLVCY